MVVARTELLFGSMGPSAWFSTEKLISSHVIHGPKLERGYVDRTQASPESYLLQVPQPCLPTLSKSSASPITFGSVPWGTFVTF